MQGDYRLESLASIFAKQADDSDLCNEAYKERQLLLYPDVPLPKYMEYPFNIARALSVMACEIERLKHLIGK
jgi:hypothetical protein